MHKKKRLNVFRRLALVSASLSLATCHCDLRNLPRRLNCNFQVELSKITPKVSPTWPQTVQNVGCSMLDVRCSAWQNLRCLAECARPRAQPGWARARFGRVLVCLE